MYKRTTPPTWFQSLYQIADQPDLPANVVEVIETTIDSERLFELIPVHLCGHGLAMYAFAMMDAYEVHKAPMFLYLARIAARRAMIAAAEKLDAMGLPIVEANDQDEEIAWPTDLGDLTNENRIRP